MVNQACLTLPNDLQALPWGVREVCCLQEDPSECHGGLASARLSSSLVTGEAEGVSPLNFCLALTGCRSLTWVAKRPPS